LAAHPENAQNSSEGTLKPKASPTPSLRSRSSANEQSNVESDADHDDNTASGAEQSEKRSRWRLSRRKDEQTSLGANLTSAPKSIGTNGGAEASTSSFTSSSRPRKSFTGETVPVGSESTLAQPVQQSSNDSGPSNESAGKEEKKGPIDWLKTKMREAKEEKRGRDAEKERTRSPPSSDRAISATAGFSTRGKSIDVKRHEADVDKERSSTGETTSNVANS